MGKVVDGVVPSHRDPPSAVEVVARPDRGLAEDRPLLVWARIDGHRAVRRGLPLQYPVPVVREAQPAAGHT